MDSDGTWGKTEIHNQPLNGMNFDFVQFKEKVLLSFYVAVRNSSSSSIRKPHSTRLGLLWSPLLSLLSTPLIYFKNIRRRRGLDDITYTNSFK